MRHDRLLLELRFTECLTSKDYTYVIIADNQAAGLCVKGLYEALPQASRHVVADAWQHTKDRLDAMRLVQPDPGNKTFSVVGAAPMVRAIVTKAESRVPDRFFNKVNFEPYVSNAAKTKMVEEEG